MDLSEFEKMDLRRFERVDWVVWIKW